MTEVQEPITMLMNLCLNFPANELCENFFTSVMFVNV